MVEDLIKQKIKKKVLLWILGIVSPLIIPVILFIVILGTACLIPLLIFAGDAMYNDVTVVQTDQIYSAVDVENITLSTKYPSEDPSLWLTGDVDINNVFASRLAALAKHYNTKIYISSGYRSIEEQWDIWNKRIREHPNETEKERRKWVAYPGKSMHQFGLAVDVKGLYKELANNDLKPFGLIKPLSNEDWHIEPIEARITPDAPEVLPDELRYTEVNRQKLMEYLEKRNSILSDDEYLDVILNVAKEKNVNPLILIAITGQEQSYVPRSSANARKIANNPFNVYHSWMEYNTNIEDSTRIASNTIINLSKGRPDTMHPLAWINKKYAEDQNWWIGVSKNYEVLKTVALN